MKGTRAIRDTWQGRRDACVPSVIGAVAGAVNKALQSRDSVRWWAIRYLYGDRVCRLPCAPLRRVLHAAAAV